MPVTKISIHDCWVCESTGYMLGLSIPDEVYYAGPGGGEEAKAAAEQEAATSREQFPPLKFLVQNLADYLSAKAGDDRALGSEGAKGYPC